MLLVRRVLLSVVFLVCAQSVLFAQTVVWDPNPETDIAGYRVHYGIQSGNYTTMVDVGNQTQYQPPPGFDWSRTLYFVVQAYNTSGLTSPFSNEVQWTPPTTTRVTSIQADVSYPLLAGRPVTWTATATGPSPIQYRFWLYRRNAWTMMRDYATSNTFTWTPSGVDIGQPYILQVWARAVGSTAQYEGFLGTPSFEIIGTPFELRADVDFPTPPGNQVTWTASVAATTTSPLEYQFMVMNQSGGGWTVFRPYATSNQAQWTPASAGTYAVQAWARAVGSTAQFEHTGVSDFFQVSPTALSVTSLTADRSSPSSTGTKIAWTARVRGGMAGPIQYQFWRHSAASGWRLAQPYSSSPTFAWTPTWGDEGDQTVQVWVRSNGSTANYEAWRSSAALRVEHAPMTLTTASLFPVAPGSHVDWLGGVADPSANLEYQFWTYSAATAQWTVARPYGTVPTFRWIPNTVGTFAVLVWGRQPGSTEDYEVYRGTDLLQVSQGPAQIASLTSNVTFPASAGTTITWTAAASGGTAGPLQYQFWRYSNGQWILARPYSSVNTYSWTPTAGDIGNHALQVWVRSAGSTAGYEAFKSTGVFSIQ
jgi:hypothetical protein